jgi:hypothetical protein
MGMVERRENLAFVPEAAHQQVGVHAAPDHLHGDQTLELLVDAASQIDRAHPAAADESFESVRSDGPIQIGIALVVRKWRKRGRVDEPARLVFSQEQRFDLNA